MAQPMKLSILIGVDASGAKGGGAQAEAALDAVTATAREAGAALDGVTATARETGAALGGTAGSANGATAAVNRMIGATAGLNKATGSFVAMRAAANDAGTAINRLIIESTGLNRAVGATQMRGDDTAAYGAQLDALRGRFNPVYAAIARYRTEVTAIRDAHRVGAISSEEMTTAISRERRATLDSIDAIKGRNAALRSTPAAANNNVQGFQTANIAAQVQDIGVMTAMGASPLQIALSQGTQLSMVFSQMQNPIQGIGAALMSVVSPVSLLTIGVIAASAATVQWLTSAEDDVKSFDSAVQAHQDTLSILKSTYGELADASAKFAMGGKTFADASLRTDIASLRKEAQTQQMALLAQISPTAGFAGLENLSGEQLKFKDDVEAFINQVRAGNPDLDAFNANVEHTVEVLRGNSQNPALLADTAELLKGLADEAVNVTGEFEKFSAPINKFKAEVAAGKGNFQEFQKSVEAIGREKGIQEQASQLITFGAKLLEINQYLKDFETLYRKAFEDRGPGGLLLSQGTTNRNDMGNLAAFQEQQRVALQRSQAAFDAQMLQAAARSPLEKAAAARATAQAEFAPDETPAARSQRINLAEKQALVNAERELQRAQDDRVRSLQASVDAQQFELSIAGRSIAEQQRLRMEYQQIAALKEQAAQTGTAVDQREVEMIRQKADEYARLAQAIAGQNVIKSQQDDIARLQLEISLVGQSADVRQRSIAAYEAEKQIRDQGIASLSAEADAIRANAQTRAQLQLQLERQQAAYQATQQAGSTMIDQLVVGTGSLKDRLKSVAETLLTTFQQLAVANPLKNMMLGTNLPTLTDLFSGKSASPIGATTTGAMTVTAGTVMINGVPLGTGTLNPSGLLNSAPANSNLVNAVRPDLMANGIVNNPLAANQNVPANLSTYAAAVRNVESGNNYSALGPVTKSGDRAYGAYQMMGNNVPSWSQQALGRTMTPEQLLADKAAQDAIFADQTQRNLAKYGNLDDAASVWHSGRPLALAQNAQDQLGTKTPDYVSNVSSEMQRLGQTTSATTQGLTSLNSSTKTLTGSLADVIGGTKLPGSTPTAPATQAGGLASVIGGTRLPTTSPNYFPAAPTSGFNPLSMLKSIPILGPLFGMFGFADGGAFSGGSVIPFASGGVVTKPMTFPMSGGRTGLMGEAGPEAIMPLERGAGGRLGVRASMPRNARQGNEVRFRMETSNTLNIYGTGDKELLAQAREGVSMQIEESERRMAANFPDMANAWRQDPWVRHSG